MCGRDKRGEHHMTKLTETEKNIIPFIPDGDFYFSKGVEAYKKRKFDLSLKWFKKAISEKPNNPLYNCQASIVYTEIGAYHLANQLLTNVLTHHGEDYIDCYYLMANNYAHLGLMQDAIKYAEKYMEKEPNGELYPDAEALVDILQWEEEESDDWALEEEDELLMHQETAFYHLEREEWEEAIAVLEEMIALFPEFTQARHEYHYALFFNGEMEEAVTREEKYLEEHPGELFSYMNLAVFYYHKDDQEKLQSIVAALNNIYPIHSQQKLRLAVTFAQIGLYDKAYTRFSMLHKTLLKGHPSYYRWFSTCLYYTGKEKRAETLWEEGCKRHSILSVQPPSWLWKQ